MTRQMYSIELPRSCVLRRAYATDTKAIQQMVYAEPLDPTGLHWSQFWVIETDTRLVAIGQLRHYSGTQELGSLVVATEWRSRGLGTLLVQYLIGQATEPLYLACGARLIPFYARLGFVPIPWLLLPCPLKLKFGFSKLLTTLLNRHLVFMQYLLPIKG